MRSEFYPIFHADQLDALIGTHESEVYDWKEYAEITNEAQRVEIAKDLAAFSNANGGTIIHGAEEVSRVDNTLKAWAPIADLTTADTHRKKILHVAKDYCAPSFNIDGRVLTVHGGGHVVVVNVFPAPGQAIGVCLPHTVRDPVGSKRVPTYFFPIRLGDQTDYLDPEQIARLMIPQLRRVVLSCLS